MRVAIFIISTNPIIIRKGTSTLQSLSQYPSSAMADKPHVQFSNCGGLYTYAMNKEKIFTHITNNCTRMLMIKFQLTSVFPSKKYLSQPARQGEK